MKLDLYTFQFQDGSWRIDARTNSPYPSNPHARLLFDGVYSNRPAATLAAVLAMRLSDSDNAPVTRALALKEAERAFPQIMGKPIPVIRTNNPFAYSV